MRTVRMLYPISGGRADGTDWPPAGETLECDDGEAAGLVAGRLAEYADETSGADVPAVSPSGPAAPEPGAAPSVRASKDDWAAYALSQGAAQDAVAAMTKAQLVAAYGKQ